MKTKVTPGDRYSQWTIIKEVESKTRHRRVLCQCDCGTTRAVLLQSLVDETSRSCGCTHNGAKKAANILYRKLWEVEKQEIRARKDAA